MTDADFKSLVSSAKSRSDEYNDKAPAEKRPPWDFNIDAPYLHHLWEEQRGCCNLCGIEMDLLGETHIKGVANMLAASTDKLDPDKGYVKGNVALVHFVCNAFKSRNQIDYLYAMARGIVETFKKRYPEVEVELAKKLVTNDGIRYYPYPTFHYTGKGSISIGGSAEVKINPNPPAPPAADAKPKPPEQPPAAGNA